VFENNDKVNDLIFLKKDNLLVILTETYMKAINPFDSEISYKLELDSLITNLTFIDTGEKSFFIGNNVNSNMIKFYSFNKTEFKKLINEFSYNGPVSKILYCYDRRTIIVILFNGLFFLQNIENEKIRKKFSYNQIPYLNGCYCCDGSTVILTNSDAKFDIFKCS
jgi:hypothetical protein